MLILWLLCPVVQAEDVSGIQKPFLWEFSAPESGVVSYLFGTIHVTDPEITRLHPDVHAAFDKAEAVWLEIDFAEDGLRQQEAMSLKAGQRLEDLVSGQTLARLDARLKSISPFLSRRSLPEYHVILWPLVLSALEAQLSHPGHPVMDMKLQTLAREAGKITGGLEDPETRVQPLAEMPLDRQIEFLEASLDVLDEDDRSSVHPLDVLTRLYCAGDSAPLEAWLDRELKRPKISDELRKAFADALLISRNEDLAEAIDRKVRAMPDAVHFVAVGTAHCLGCRSVPDRLRQRGYAIRRSEITAASTSDASEEVREQPSGRVQELSR